MDRRMHRVLGTVAACLILTVAALFASVVLPNLSSPPAPSPGSPTVHTAGPGLYFDYVVIVIMENKNLCELYTHCGGSAAYMTSVADAYSMLLNYRYCNQNPSLPNYLCLSGATNFGCTGNYNPHSNACTNTAWTSPNIVDRLETGGVTWKAYMENMPSNCYGSDSGSYAVRHDPFVYYQANVAPARCGLIVPVSSGASAMISDLGSTSTAKNFMWLTPNNCNNMHDCSIATGDSYLATLVPQILTSNVFVTQRAALFLVVDEGYGNPTYAAWAGPVAKTAYTSNVYYDAYSYLKTIETNWGLSSLNSNDQNAAAMSEFFAPAGPDFSLSANPASVSFLAGQSATSTITLTSIGGFSGTVALTTASAPAGVSASCVPSSISGSQTSTCTISGSTPGSYTLTVTGTSGSLVHTTSVSVTVTAPPTPDFSLSANPTSVSFPGGQSTTSTITLQSTGGFTGTVALTTASAPTGVTGSCVPSSISGSQTSTCTISGTTPGSYTLTVTGTSGSLVHSVSISVTVAAAGPVARFTFTPTVPKVNDTVTFDASSSSDSDPGATLQARWDWEGDGTWDTSFSSTLTAQHAFATAGTYPVKLQIQDSLALSDTTSQAVVVLNLGSGGIGAPPGFGLIDPSRLQPHGPIYIGANAQFTAANGVRRGTGTLVDPYVISDWFIDGNLYTTSPAMIWIENTNAYVVIENVKITNLTSTNQWEAFQLGHWPATITTQHVTIRHNAVENARHAYGVAVREGSSDVHIEANYIQLDANFDWVYGIATDRGVQAITVFGNYVNAYTSGAFHTVGIHLSDYHVTDARRATGMVATRNTVVNATAGGIISESSVGTIIGWNLVYMDYPGSKSVATDYPRGIETEWFSNGTLVIGNVVHTFHWGIQVGSDGGTIASNTIYDVDYGIYVLDTGAWPGISSAAETIYDTTWRTVAIAAIRLPSNFQGTVVDLGPGIKKTDLTPVVFRTSTSPTRVSYSWIGSVLNLSAVVGGAVVFDVTDTVDSQTLSAAWTGSIASLKPSAFSAGGVSFQLQSSADVVFDGSGFTPSTTYNLTRSNGAGTTRILSALSSPTGGLVLTIPAAVPSTYSITPGNVQDTIPPVTTWSATGTGGANSWYKSSVSVSLTATDDLSGVASIHIRTDGGAWQTYTGAVVVQGEGSHAIDYYGTDYSGNNEAVRTATLKIDTATPTTSAQVAGTTTGDGSFIASVNVTLTSTDATSGVGSIQYRIDGGAWRDYSAAFPLSGNGTHNVEYTATDVAGNVESAKSTIVRITGSVHSPPVTVLSIDGTLGMNGWYVSVVNVTLMATSSSGTATSIAYSVNSGAWTTYTQRFVVGEGSHTIAWQAFDVAGYFEPMGTEELQVDLTRPLLGLSSPSGRLTNPEVTISWSASDDASGIAGYEVSIDGGVFESVGTATSITRRLSNGQHTVEVKAYDNAGHESVSDSSFTVDTSGSVFPGLFQAIPLYFPALGLGLLLASYAFLLRRRRKREETDQAEREQDEFESDFGSDL